MRGQLRQAPPAVLMTNSEMLHMSFLGNSHLCERFLKDLKFLVLDEIHEYRGYFGTNLVVHEAAAALEDRDHPPKLAHPRDRLDEYKVRGYYDYSCGYDYS